MPRPRTGTIERHGDHWDARLTLVDGARPRICLPADLTEAQARERTQRLARVAIEEGATMPPAPPSPGAAPPAPHRDAVIDGETLEAWTERWCAARDRRGLSSVDDDRGRLRKWVLPVLGPDTPIAAITTRDLEQLVEHLDEQVRAGALSWKTAKNVWGVVSKMFKDAHRSKVLALRVREDNPALGVCGPDEGTKKSKSYLYPSEFVALITCERAPLRWRRLFTVAIYTYARAAELEALEWEDVDLEHGLIHIHRAIDRSKDGEVKETKTNNPRRIPIEPALVPLLQQMKRERGATERRVLSMPPECDLSARLRQYLEWAGVARAELFANDATRKQITFHDLRATGITWMAIRGDEAMKIMRRAGHASLSTTMIYVREAENIESPVSDVFPPLPYPLVSSEETSEGPATWGLTRGNYYKNKGVPRGAGNVGTGAGRPGACPAWRTGEAGARGCDRLSA